MSTNSNLLGCGPSIGWSSPTSPQRAGRRLITVAARELGWRQPPHDRGRESLSVGGTVWFGRLPSPCQRGSLFLLFFFPFAFLPLEPGGPYLAGGADKVAEGDPGGGPGEHDRCHSTPTGAENRAFGPLESSAGHQRAPKWAASPSQNRRRARGSRSKLRKSPHDLHVPKLRGMIGSVGLCLEAFGNWVWGVMDHGQSSVSGSASLSFVFDTPGEEGRDRLRTAMPTDSFAGRGRH